MGRNHSKDDDEYKNLNNIENNNEHVDNNGESIIYYRLSHLKNIVRNNFVNKGKKYIDFIPELTNYTINLNFINSEDTEYSFSHINKKNSFCKSVTMLSCHLKMSDPSPHCLLGLTTQQRRYLNIED